MPSILLTRRPDFPSHDRPIKLALFLIPVLLVIAWTHAPSLDARAIMFDDDQYFVHNELVNSPGLKSTARFFTELLKPSTVDGYYHPLAMTSLMIDCALGAGPSNLRPFHRTSLILHLANSALLAIFLYSLSNRAMPSALCALLFGVHPFSVESLCWIGERKTLLAAFFALLCLTFHLRHARRHRPFDYAAALACFFLSLLSKPAATMLPFAMILLDLWPLRRLNRRALLQKIPFLALALASALITYTSQTRTYHLAPTQSREPATIPLLLLYTPCFYLRNLVFPIQPSAYFPFPAPFTLTSLPILTGVICTVTLLLTAWKLRRRAPALAIALAGFLILIFPALGLIGFHPVIAADRHAYLPFAFLLIGLCGAIGRSGAGFQSHPTGNASQPQFRGIGFQPVTPAIEFKPHSSGNGFRPVPPASSFTPDKSPHSATPIWPLAFCLLVAIPLIVQSRRASAHWQNNETLFRYFCRVAPEVPVLHRRWALALKEKGRPEEAVRALEKALALDPDYAMAMADLGGIRADQRREDQARALFTRAVSLRPDSPALLRRFAAALHKLGRDDEAARLEKKAADLHRSPDNPHSIP